MSSESIESSIGEKPAYVVEIMGLAGTGKTTLSNILSIQNQKIRVGVELPKIRYLPFYIDIAQQFLPSFLFQNGNSRRFNRGEIRAMVYLRAWHQVLESQKSDHGFINLLDHGPIYRLALLREFGPEAVASPRINQWWCKMLNQWAATLDMIVWLDAPDSVLLERIHTRKRWHVIKKLSEQEGYEYLRRYRMAFKQTIAMLPAQNCPTIIRLETDRETASQTASRIQAVLMNEFMTQKELPC